MSSTATPTGTATSAAASATGCGVHLYEIPVQDAACALPYGGNHTDIMADCCKSADVVAYGNNCGLYCLAIGQNVTGLADCMQSDGAAPQDVFCSGTGNATATATASDTLASGASVVVTASSSKNTGGSSASGSASSSSSTSSSNAAPRIGPSGVSLTLSGVTISALLFTSVLFGALQI